MSVKKKVYSGTSLFRSINWTSFQGQFTDPPTGRETFHWCCCCDLIGDSLSRKILHGRGSHAISKEPSLHGQIGDKGEHEDQATWALDRDYNNIRAMEPWERKPGMDVVLPWLEKHFKAESCAMIESVECLLCFPDLLFSKDLFPARGCSNCLSALFLTQLCVCGI